MSEQRARRKRTAKDDSPAPGRQWRGGHPAVPQVASGWALERVANHVTFAGKDGSRMTAWYLLDPQMWSFRSVGEGESLIRSHAATVASLTGRTIHGRITTRPYPVASWAKTAWDNSPAPTNGFARILERDQRQLHGRVQSDKLVYYGVDLGTRSALLAKASKFLTKAAERELADLQVRLEELDGLMAGLGVEASPATGDDMAWLLARSFALGCPLPEQTHTPTYSWEAEDLAEFTAGVRWSAEPLAQSVRIDSTHDEQPVTRHVVVLTVGRMAELRIPEGEEPWIAKSDNLPFPVEWSFRVDVRPGEDTSKEMNRQADRISSQISHYVDDHGMSPPKQLARQGERARQVEDEMRTGFDGLSTRTRSWFRIAVSGVTEEEALKRAAAVQTLYKPGIKIEREFDQYRLAREFVPGEPLANNGHTRHMPVLKLAAGVPAATAEVGDKRGVLMGYTAGFTKAAVMFDPWYGPEVLERSGLCPICGTLGSGKTILGAGIVFKTCCQGVPWTILDPSGMLGGLTKLPEFKGISANPNLLHSEPGALNPYAMVPMPQPEWFADEDDPQLAYMLALSAAEAERRDLAEDTLRWCLPPQTLARDGATDILSDAIWAAPASVDSMLDEVLDNIRERARGEGKDVETATAVLNRLEEARERERGRLFFATSASGDRGEGLEGRRLTVYSLKGMTVPDKDKPMHLWTFDERMSRPIMSLASWATLRGVYRMSRHERKGVMLDEAHEITAVSSGATLVQKGSTDSRKHNLAFLVLTQNASRVLGQGVENFVGASFVGRTKGENEQAAATKLLSLPASVGYEEQFGALSPQSRRNPKARTPREFVFRDGHGGMEKIVVDFNSHPEFMDAVNSTADPTKTPTAVPDDVPALDLEGAIA